MWSYLSYEGWIAHICTCTNLAILSSQKDDYNIFSFIVTMYWTKFLFEFHSISKFLVYFRVLSFIFFFVYYDTFLPSP